MFLSRTCAVLHSKALKPNTHGTPTAESYAHPWLERYGSAEVKEHWYKDYQIIGTTPFIVRADENGNNPSHEFLEISRELILSAAE